MRGLLGYAQNLAGKRAGVEIVPACPKFFSDFFLLPEPLEIPGQFRDQ